MAPPRAARVALLLVALLAAASASGAAATGVFQVRRKFPAGGAGGNITAHLAHDGNRRGRLLAAADLPLGGLGLPTDTGLYYTEIGIGTPSKRYYVQVDTGSDILWVNCISCDRCPRKSGLGIELTLYDPKDSSTANTVSCEQGFCTATYGGMLPGCSMSVPCEYSVMYGDGSSTTGFFVSDFLQYDQVSGDGQTRHANASVTFGCGAQQGGDLGSSNQALDGILGFGQSNSSMLSQLAAAGKVKKIFSHCLDTINGGGIFAIGDVVQPKVKTTPLVPNMPHYNVNLESINVGGTALQFPSHIFETGEKKGTIIDSGTTLTYLPEVVYKEVMVAVFAKHQDIAFHNIQDFLCFQYVGSVDDGFPKITFHFEDDLALNVYPHDYFFQNGNNLYCVGFQNGGLQSKEGKDMVLLGDLVLSNKLVVYDLENQVIGWTEYNFVNVISAVAPLSERLRPHGGERREGLPEQHLLPQYPRQQGALQVRLGAAHELPASWQSTGTSWRSGTLTSATPWSSSASCPLWASISRSGTSAATNKPSYFEIWFDLFGCALNFQPLE